MDLRDAAARLGGEVRCGQILCPGPRHSDEDRSLAVKFNGQGDFVIHSFAHDDPLQCRDFVRARLGLPAWKPGGKDNNMTRLPLERPRPKPARPFSDGMLRRLGYRRTARHRYLNQAGDLLFEVVRYEHRTKPKKFLQRRPDRNGGWLAGSGDTRVLYNLPALAAAATRKSVFLTEGEKNADRLIALGLIATTVPSGSWRDVDCEPLRGRSVYILQDNDDAGRKKAAAAAQALAGVAASVRVVALPGLAAREDVSDWLDRNGDDTKELVKICKATPLHAAADEAFTAAALKDMEFEPIKYVVPGWFVEGLTIFAGKPKIGKSWLVLHAAIAVAVGGETLGEQCDPGDALYCALEDNQRRLKYRMTKLFGRGKAWPGSLHFRVTMPRLNEGGLDALKRWIKTAAKPRLIIIDTLTRVRTPNKENTNNFTSDYDALKELHDFATQHGVAVVIVHHLRKAEADDPLDAVSGTLGLGAAADTIIAVQRLKDGDCVIHGRGRDLPPIAKAAEFDKETHVWKITGDAEAAQRSVQRTAILDVLNEAGGPLGPREIAAATGMRDGNVRFLLYKMLRDGSVESIDRGKYQVVSAQC